MVTPPGSTWRKVHPSVRMSHIGGGVDATNENDLLHRLGCL